MNTKYHTIIIGGGFFGMYIAEYFAKQGQKVLLLEKENDFMQHASFVNQARVHNGYHYPRSILTALRSRVSFPNFSKEFEHCIDDSFEKYYAIGKTLSNVTAKQFEQFCKRIKAPCDPAPHKIKSLFNSSLVDEVFSTVEYAFDAVKLKSYMRERLDAAGVKYHLNTEVTKVEKGIDGVLSIFTDQISSDNNQDCYTSNQVFNCTYSMINNLLKKSNIPEISLKHELAELCLVDVPIELKDKGFTMMCGPFFSVMPFPAKNTHCFSHVRYTPHFHWYDNNESKYIKAHSYFDNINKQSAWKKMKLDAMRYMPVIEKCSYTESLWEVKTVLPRSEANDSRPILFNEDYGINGLHSIMGGKIDNVYDVIDEIKKSENVMCYE